MKPGYKKRGCLSPDGCYCTGACQEEVLDINAFIVDREEVDEYEPNGTPARQSKYSEQIKAFIDAMDSQIK